MEFLNVEKLEEVRKTKESWLKWETLVDVVIFYRQKREEEEREKKIIQENKRKRDDEDRAAASPAAAKKPRKNWPIVYQQPDTDPEMPERLRRKILEMGGENWSLVIEKKLFGSDISAQHNRLSMPMNQIRRDFVTEEERRRLNSADGNANGLEVVLVEPSLQVEEVMLKKWKMKETSVLYVLIKNWHYIAERNGLNANDVVRVWAFRIDSRLCFAIDKVGEDEDDSGKGKGKTAGKKKKKEESGSGKKGKEVLQQSRGNQGGSTSHARGLFLGPYL